MQNIQNDPGENTARGHESMNSEIESESTSACTLVRKRFGPCALDPWNKNSTY